MTTQKLGPYTAGERPPPLTVGFRDKQVPSQPIPFPAGAVARWVIKQGDGPGETRTTATVDQAASEATYPWTDEDMATPGWYSGQMWVGTAAGQKFASDRFEWRVDPAVGAVSWT